MTADKPASPSLPPFAYKVTMSGRDAAHTLPWLSERGYDAGFLERAELLEVRDPNGQPVDDAEVDWTADNGPRALEGYRATYGLTEAEAHEVWEDYNEDPSAFLACCGSETLTQALLGLIDGIV